MMNIDIPILDKLKIIIGLFTPEFLYTRKEGHGEKLHFIFRKGYAAGLKDRKLECDYKVVTSDFNEQIEQEFLFDDFSPAAAFVLRYQKDNPKSEGNACTFLQTYADRDVMDLLPKPLKSS